MDEAGKSVEVLANIMILFADFNSSVWNIHMTSIRSTALCIFCLLLCLNFSGCLATRFITPKNLTDSPLPTSLSSPANNILVFFVRHANFAGGGRSHLLKIDDTIIGQLTDDNYYRFEMWPGQYLFSVTLPKEEFFGQISPPDNISRQLTLKHHPAGRAYICSYTDGLGSSGFTLERINQFPQCLKDRTPARSLTARETAQVTQLFKARYDGPAMMGRPHGQGTLYWPDGGMYKGTFLHGKPTRKARFIFPDGRIFMGPYTKGRPADTGLLISETGEILFAGDFVNEQPDGVGLRNGTQGPEFCIYDNGSDITKTFRQLAKEALDIEDPQEINAYLNRVEKIEVEIESEKKRFAELSSRHDPDKLRKALRKHQKRIKLLKKRKRGFELNMEADNKAFIERLRDTRFKRELAESKHFRKLHQAAIEKERQWCMDEFAQGRNLCGCAPFADDFDQWEECWEPLRPRFTD
jgi:hypothetical protein